MKHDLSNVRNSDLIAAINEYVHNERYRQILISRYVHGKTVGELADEYHLSEDGIKKILRKNEYVLLKVTV